eukprot:48442_1
MQQGLAILLMMHGTYVAMADDIVSISSSCNDKTVDGLYYIKPSEKGSIIPVICSGGYTMLDASLNYESLSTYFTSMYQYGDEIKMMYGTDCGDSSGWRDWYVPANDNTNFRVALGCEECKTGEMYGDNTAYYMTNVYFCPVNLDIDGCSPKKRDLQTEPDIMCNVCDDDSGICGSGHGRDGETIYDQSAVLSWCDCYTLQLTADHKTTSIHSEYCQQDLNWRPNLVLDRSQCTCYKPLDEELKLYSTQDLSADDLPLVSATYKSQIINDLGLYVDDLIQWDDSDSDSDEISRKECLKKRTYLTNDDFKYGTYRITECGNYILSEDIVVNFNKPSIEFDYAKGDSPNAYNMDDLYWYPTTQQQQSDEYFGLDAFWGPYSLGFFAAISVETKHVYIDLNEFSISMDYEFYLQQRFFAIIEFGNKQFESRQGPVDFGREDLCNGDIIVKNGVLGLSSHHGIHGSCVSHVHISNVVIKDFDVGGIQCNGCFKMLIEQSKIGPQNTDIPVRGRYTHARIVLSRLRYLVDEYGDEELTFANRNGKSSTMRQLADTLVEEMDMVYYHIMKGIEYDEKDPLWIEAQQLFINQNGWMDGGSSYGILLNGLGTAVVNIGRRLARTWDITIRDVEITGIKLKPHEGFWAQSHNKIIHGFFFETIDWNGNVYEPDTGYYVGDAYTDLLFAANALLQSDFCPLGSLFYLDGLMGWAFTDETSIWSKHVSLTFQCGSDIQSHSAKGAIGIRIDGTKRFNLENIYIHDLVNWGSLGSDACGEYEQITFETGVDVDKDIQYGYTGGNVQGILTDYATGSMKNIKVESLESWHGTSSAISIFKGSAVELKGYVEVNNIVAGSKLTQSQVDHLKLPNAVPYTCSIQIGLNSDDDDAKTPIISVADDFVVTTNNMYAYDYCDETTRVGEMNTPAIPQNLNLAMESTDNNCIGCLLPFHGYLDSSFSILVLSMLGVMFLIMATRKWCDCNTNTNKLNQNTVSYGSLKTIA